jgi:hypothetical protein
MNWWYALPAFGLWLFMLWFAWTLIRVGKGR